MTRALIVALVCATGVAHADEDRAAFGFRIGMGAIPASGEHVFTPSVGLAVEHPFAARWSLFGEYEWIWLYGARTSAMREERGDGQRVQVGLRHRVGEHVWKGLGMFADVELGGGYMLANDTMTGVLAKPDAFIGARLGYDLHSTVRSPSSAFEPELLLRGIATPDGLGMLFGVGALWQ